MTKRFFILLAALCSAVVLLAQAPQAAERPQRTPEEEARKQTLRLVRELGILDSVRIDTIYRMHLKYARTRQQGMTRQQNLDRMQAIYAELKQLLTPEEFDKFMNHPVESGRRSHAPALRQVAPSDGEGQKPEGPSTNQ